MFEDKRSKKVMLVAHCVLNQNAKIDRCAHYPGAMKEVTEQLIEAGVGLIQMPCPELLYLGLDRQVERDAETTVESEDTRVARRMAETPGQTLCNEITNTLIYQIEEYRRNGFEVVGLIGINGSPTCGVEITWLNDRESPERGVFIDRLHQQLTQKGLTVPMRGIRASEPQQAQTAISELLE